MTEPHNRHRRRRDPNNPDSGDDFLQRMMAERDSDAPPARRRSRPERIEPAPPRAPERPASRVAPAHPTPNPWGEPQRRVPRQVPEASSKPPRAEQRDAVQPGDSLIAAGQSSGSDGERYRAGLTTVGSTSTGSTTARASRQPRPDRATVKRRRRVALSVVLVIFVALVAGLGYAGLRWSGAFSHSEDYSNAAGTGDVLVDIPKDASLTKFGEILHDKGVVASVGSFTEAAGGKPISAGFYKMRTGIPAEKAVASLNGTQHRVGRLVIPAGRQLDTKAASDGNKSTGILAMLAEASKYTLNGKEHSVTVAQLAKAAATASPAALGVPSWATEHVQKLTGDHRRLEGLIAPVAWESIDPTLSAVDMLKYLITQSAATMDAWGLTSASVPGMNPYKILASASIVEKEVAKPDDYGKVARVIVNRLGKDQRLQMDSTVNYTAALVDYDVAGDDYRAPTAWNTYQMNGLPATPIGAVGEEALKAAENPPTGPWLYFVAVDSSGTTLFTEDYKQHLRNRQLACTNKVLAVGCQ